MYYFTFFFLFRYNALERKYKIEYTHRNRVEEDFRVSTGKSQIITFF